LKQHASLVLTIGVACASTGAIFIRLADAPPLVTAAWRLTFASAVVIPVALATSSAELAALSRRDIRVAIVSGAALAAHFATWVASLDHTSVASSVVIVSTTPLWVGLAAPAVLGERASRKLLAGILVAFIGGVAIGWGDFTRGGAAAFGDLLALCGAWAAAAYFMIGRRLRASMSLIPYIALVYGTAAVILVAAALAAGDPLFGYEPSTWSAFVAMALLPQIVGHSSFNWALQHLSSTFVSGTALGEPLGSTVLAWLVLDEAPPPATVFGGSLILIGLFIAARAETKNQAPQAQGC
jgi:drug/metabolite transporter (DMT)-like permease